MELQFLLPKIFQSICPSAISPIPARDDLAIQKEATKLLVALLVILMVAVANSLRERNSHFFPAQIPTLRPP